VLAVNETCSGNACAHVCEFDQHRDRASLDASSHLYIIASTAIARRQVREGSVGAKTGKPYSNRADDVLVLSLFPIESVNAVS
jgi:hypothetical protein